MSVLRDAGEAAKGDQRGRKGGFKGKNTTIKGATKRTSKVRLTIKVGFKSKNE